jgi:hypothetical protein
MDKKAQNMHYLALTEKFAYLSLNYKLHEGGNMFVLFIRMHVFNKLELNE